MLVQGTLAVPPLPSGKSDYHGHSSTASARMMSHAVFWAEMLVSTLGNSHVAAHHWALPAHHPTGTTPYNRRTSTATGSGGSLHPAGLGPAAVGPSSLQGCFKTLKTHRGC